MNDTLDFVHTSNEILTWFFNIAHILGLFQCFWSKKLMTWRCQKRPVWPPSKIDTFSIIKLSQICHFFGQIRHDSILNIFFVDISEQIIMIFIRYFNEFWWKKIKIIKNRQGFSLLLKMQFSMKFEELLKTPRFYKQKQTRKSKSQHASDAQTLL